MNESIINMSLHEVHEWPFVMVIRMGGAYRSRQNLQDEEEQGKCFYFGSEGYGFGFFSPNLL